MRLVTFAVCLVAMAGCSAPTTASPSPSPLARSLAPSVSLPVVHGTPLPTFEEPFDVCAGQDLAHFTVRLDSTDPWLVWFEIAEAGRIDVFWPAGYGAEFGDPPTVIDADGQVLFTDGQFVTDSHPVCNGPDSSVIFEPEG